MSRSLAYSLHALTAQLDRAADRILTAEIGVTYRRFLALFMVDEVQATSQRSLADRLGLTEPSVSRMTTVLAEAGLLTVTRDAGSGNKRALALTPAGRDLVGRCRTVLDTRFTELITESGVDGDRYGRDTARLLAALDVGKKAATRG